MKRVLLTSLAALLAVVNVWGAGEVNTPVSYSPGIMKALPVYSNDLIDEAPAGEVIKGIRNCYSSYFMGGNNYRDFQKGVAGEYVMGTDGNIYLRAVCYSASKISDKTDTYLKLEKVDGNTYVAHTPQLIWVDETGDSPFTAYATRVVFSQKSATSFGYEVAQDEDGSYDTDIYFTLSDGKLRQRNAGTVEMNGEIFPEELIGFTSSTGGWIGFGDGCLEIYQPEDTPATVPAGVAVQEKSLAYTLLHVRDIELNDAAVVRYAEDGNDIYLSNPSGTAQQWIKGTIDRQKGTATFTAQYLGIDSENGYAVWFHPAVYDKFKNVFDEETGYGDWYRTYTAKDELVFDYSDGVLTARKGDALFFSHSPDELLETGIFCDPAVKGSIAPVNAKPAPVKFTKFEEYDDLLWGFGVIGFAIPRMSTDGEYINPDELYYNLYAEGATTPFVFTPDDYIDMQVESMVDVPYAYVEDFDFKVNGINHTVYFYHPWSYIGVQVIHKHDGQETRSDIVYSNGDANGIESVTVGTRATKTYKYIENGRIIIVRDGDKYDVMGCPVK